MSAACCCFSAAIADLISMPLMLTGGSGAAPGKPWGGDPASPSCCAAFFTSGGASGAFFTPVAGSDLAPGFAFSAACACAAAAAWAVAAACAAAACAFITAACVWTVAMQTFCSGEPGGIFTHCASCPAGSWP